MGEWESICITFPIFCQNGMTLQFFFMNLDLETKSTQYKKYWDGDIEIIEFPITYKQICEKYSDSLDTKRYMLSLETGYLISEKVEKFVDLKNEKV